MSTRNCAQWHDFRDVQSPTCSAEHDRDYEFVTKPTFELLDQGDKYGHVGCSYPGFDQLGRLFESVAPFKPEQTKQQQITLKPKQQVVEWKTGPSHRKLQIAAWRKLRSKQAKRKEIPGRESETIRCKRLQEREEHSDLTVVETRCCERDSLESSERGTAEDIYEVRDPPPTTPVGRGVFLVPLLSSAGLSDANVSREISSPNSDQGTDDVHSVSTRKARSAPCRAVQPIDDKCQVSSNKRFLVEGPGVSDPVIVINLAEVDGNTMEPRSEYTAFGCKYSYLHNGSEYSHFDGEDKIRRLKSQKIREIALTKADLKPRFRTQNPFAKVDI